MTTVEFKTSERTASTGWISNPPAQKGFASQPKSSLARAVRAAVESVNEGNLFSPFPKNSVSTFGAKSLLAVICFYYARGIYASKEIEAAFWRETGCQDFQHGPLPDASVVHDFLRHNLEPIRFCLVGMLSFMAAEKVASGFVTKVNRAHIEAEASRRITAALFLDTLGPGSD